MIRIAYRAKCFLEEHLTVVLASEPNVSSFGETFTLGKSAEEVKCGDQ